MKINYWKFALRVADYIKRPRSTVTPAMYRKYKLNGFTIEKVTV